MNRIPCVTMADYRGGYRIHVTFDDNSEKTIDFRRYLKGSVFEPLRDVKYFRRFFLDGWTVAWRTVRILPLRNCTRVPTSVRNEGWPSLKIETDANNRCDSSPLTLASDGSAIRFLRVRNVPPQLRRV